MITEVFRITEMRQEGVYPDLLSRQVEKLLRSRFHDTAQKYGKYQDLSFRHLQLNSSTFLSSIYPVRRSSICTGPIPAGVPVYMMSPVFKVKNLLI